MKSPATYQKLRGGYYTPELIGDALADWAIQSATATVLEPSCGNGVLLQAAVETLRKRGASSGEIASLVHGIEIDAQEATKSAARLRSLHVPSVAEQIHVGDFFTRCKALLAQQQRFDAVIGNPPFIRYQNFHEEHRRVAFQLMYRAGLSANRLTNAWVPFLVAATLLLNEQGRLAMVIPAELLQVNYAARLRKFLSERYSTITLLTFRKLLFEGIQQEVVLLFGERNGSRHTGIRTIELDSTEDLPAYEHTAFMTSDPKPMCHSTEKWTQYFLDADEIKLLRTLREEPNLALTGDVFEVDVGIVTGLNDFFVLTDEQARVHDLLPFTHRLVGRSGQLAGVLFRNADWTTQVAEQLPAYLLQLPDVPLEKLSPAVRSYIRSGEAKSFHTGYKCRIRNHWYVVPSVWTPHAFMLRQIHHHPKIALNQAAATCTDTIHRIRFRSGIDRRAVVSAFLNSLTFAFAEVIGRSYGGGVLELEPNEAERLPLPLKGVDRLDLNQLDSLVRAKKMETILDATDYALLVKGLGLTVRETRMLRTIWCKLRDRRIQRKHKSTRRLLTSTGLCNA